MSDTFIPATCGGWVFKMTHCQSPSGVLHSFRPRFMCARVCVLQPHPSTGAYMSMCNASHSMSVWGSKRKINRRTHMPGYLPLLLLIGLACSSAAVLEEAQQLLSCYNRNATAESLYFRDFVNGRASKMTLHTILWSTKLVSDMTPSNNTSKPAGSLHPLTIVTTANKQRLGTLEAQCNSWPGPLTAAIWVPLENDSGGLNSSKNAAVVNETLLAAQSLFDRYCPSWAAVQRMPLHAVQQADGTCLLRYEQTEVSPTSCALRLLLMTELLGERAAKWLYPINSLRNAAILASDTPMVAMVDVDLLLSNTLAKEMMPLGRGSGRERATSRSVAACRATWQLHQAEA
ncbi:chlorophyll a-b binding protein, chloroplastic [Haematococcus lacustris]|uniref:Chlorophyll a-b binding protein, chloroplastic n=1 Tax=Haematococcus lacustris TaxID=44745 RepID=A0A699ZMW2_HAELA|nr:chlorophyll a-b binding protein, chloroplastic [Haematococcus lacustris]